MIEIRHLGTKPLVLSLPKRPSLELVYNNVRGYYWTNEFKLHEIIINCSVVEPHHFYAAPAPGKNFDAAPAPAPTLLYSKEKILKRTKV
jgi:hypothetical protein